MEVEFIRRKHFRKEDRVAEIMARRGNQPGLVHVFSAMESCNTFEPWHDKKSGRTGTVSDKDWNRCPTASEYASKDRFYG